MINAKEFFPRCFLLWEMVKINPFYGVNFCEWYMIGDPVSFFFFCIWISSFPNIFIEDTILYPLYVLDTLVKIQLPVYAWVISRLSILFHWPMYLCQHHNVLITIALQCSLKQGSVMPAALFFLRMFCQFCLCFQKANSQFCFPLFFQSIFHSFLL